MATELEQQQPPGCCFWGRGSLDLGFRISLFPGGSAAWGEQGFRTSIHFPLPQLCPNARSGDVQDLGRCRVPLTPSWADVRSLDGSARPGNAERDPGAMLWEQIPSLCVQPGIQRDAEAVEELCCHPCGTHPQPWARWAGQHLPPSPWKSPGAGWMFLGRGRRGWTWLIQVTQRRSTGDPGDLLTSAQAPGGKRFPLPRDAPASPASPALFPSTSDIKSTIPLPSVGTQQRSQGRIPAQPCRTRRFPAFRRTLEKPPGLFPAELSGAGLVCGAAFAPWGWQVPRETRRCRVCPWRSQAVRE